MEFNKRLLGCVVLRVAVFFSSGTHLFLLYVEEECHCVECKVCNDVVWWCMWNDVLVHVELLKIVESSKMIMMWQGI